MTRFATALVVVALLPFAAPQPAQAQLGGLIKKKVTEAVRGPEKKPDQKPQTRGSEPGGQGSVFNSDILEITEPVFAGVIRGLETEVRLQGEFRKELAKYPTQEQYDQCMMKVAQNPEYMKIMETAGKAGENAKPEQAMAAQQKMQSDLEALVKKTCPIKPVDSEWPLSERRARLDSIHVQAAESGGSGGNGGLTDRQYSVAIERIHRLCDYLNGPAGVGVVPDTLQQQDTTQKRLLIRGTGTKIFWVFSARETSVLNSASCGRFKDLSKRVMVIS